jgi:hypothetical protein
MYIIIGVYTMSPKLQSIASRRDFCVKWRLGVSLYKFGSRVSRVIASSLKLEYISRAFRCTQTSRLKRTGLFMPSSFTRKFKRDYYVSKDLNLVTNHIVISQSQKSIVVHRIYYS